MADAKVTEPPGLAAFFDIDPYSRDPEAQKVRRMLSGIRVSREWLLYFLNLNKAADDSAPVEESVAVKTDDYTVTDNDYLIKINAESNDVTITLPTPVNKTYPFVIKRIDDSDFVGKVVVVSDGTIDDETEQYLYEKDSMSVRADTIQYLIAD